MHGVPFSHTCPGAAYCCISSDDVHAADIRMSALSVTSEGSSDAKGTDFGQRRWSSSARSVWEYTSCVHVLDTYLRRPCPKMFLSSQGRENVILLKVKESVRGLLRHDVSLVSRNDRLLLYSVVSSNFCCLFCIIKHCWNHELRQNCQRNAETNLVCHLVNSIYSKWASSCLFDENCKETQLLLIFL